MDAMRELKARSMAEAQHRQLRSAVLAQDALIREYRLLLRDRVRCEETLERRDWREGSYQHEKLRIEPSEAEFYVAYVKKVDATYAETDEILRRGFDSSPDASRQTQTVDNNTGCFQFTDQRVVPFELKKVCDTNWRFHSSQRQSVQEIYGRIQDHESTVVNKFRVTTHLKTGMIGSILQRMAIRNYREDERVVTVWRVFAEGEGIFTSMQAEETGWAVTTPLNKTGKDHSLVRICGRYMPMVSYSFGRHEAAKKYFAEVVVGVGSKTTSVVSDTLEKMLLRDEIEHVSH